MAWKVQMPDGSWQNTDDLTGIELEAISAATGTPWIALQPFREIGDYRAIVAAFNARTDSMNDAEIAAWFNSRSMRELEAGCKFVAPGDDDRPSEYEEGLPKGVAADSTG